MSGSIPARRRSRSLGHGWPNLAATWVLRPYARVPTRVLHFVEGTFNPFPQPVEPPLKAGRPPGISTVGDHTNTTVADNCGIPRGLPPRPSGVPDVRIRSPARVPAGPRLPDRGHRARLAGAARRGRPAAGPLLPAVGGPATSRCLRGRPPGRRPAQERLAVGRDGRRRHPLRHPAPAGARRLVGGPGAGRAVRLRGRVPGGCRGDGRHRRDGLPQEGHPFGRGGAAVLRHAGQGGQLPGGGLPGLRRGPRPHAAGRELYLPEAWTKDPARLQAAGLVPDTPFATKPQLARRMPGGSWTRDRPWPG